MSAGVVLEQMIIILILIAVGFFLYKKKLLTSDGSTQLSALIVNVTNPAMLICSALDGGAGISLRELGIAALVFLGVYVLLMALAYLIPLVLGVSKPERYSYRMLTLFGNVGFIGIPLASAVLGSGSLVYVSLSNLIYNLLIYTYVYAVLDKAGRMQAQLAHKNGQISDVSQSDRSIPDAAEAVSEVADTGENMTRVSENDAPKSGKLSSVKKAINPGTISALITIVLYLVPIHVPDLLSETLNYMGRATTFLSMLVLGVSVAQMAFRDIFTKPRLYIYTLLRQLLVPVIFALALRPFIQNTLLLNTAVLLLAVPAGNMPLMISRQMHVDEHTIAQGIILTTLLSILTIPAVTLMCQ